MTRKAMPKNHISTTVFTAILALFLSFAPFTSFAADDESSRILQVISNFYSEYLKDGEARMDSGESMELIAYLSRRADVDPAYVKRLAEEIAEAEEKYPETGLDYDPILVAQDFPQKMAYDAPLISGSTAGVVVHKIWGETEDEDNPSKLCVVLSKKNGTWVISDIIDMQYQEFKGECGVTEQ